MIHCMIIIIGDGPRTVGKDQDDGGFLTPGSKRRGSSPSSAMNRDSVQGPSPRAHAPPLARPPPNSHPLPTHAPNSVPDLNVAPHPDSYNDFLRGLSQRGVVVPQWQGVRSLPGRYHPRGHRPHGHRHSHGSNRGHGYESDVGPGYMTDTGYRSDTGYKSDTGYRSDTGHLHKHCGGPRGAGLTVRDGYNSDRDSLQRRGGRSQSRHSGYSSDSSMRNRAPPMRNSYVPPSKPPQPRLAAPNHHIPPSPYSQLNNSHKYPDHRPPVGAQGYSNIPMTNRITIRPDEMYPGQTSGNAAPGSEENTSQTHVKRGSVSDEQSLSGRSVRDSIKEEPEANGSSEDDQYKAQLYKASVKLQKSPSEKSHRLSVRI